VLKKYPREWWLEQDIDGWEIYNGFGFLDEEALDFIEKKKGKKIMFASAGTDVHDPAKHLRMYTWVKTNTKTVKGVIEALKKGNTEAFYFKKEEKSRERPERGRLIENKERKDFIRKWFWLFWAGDALLMGNHRRALVTFSIGIILLGILLSLFF
jgi:hypothetical protein